MAKDDKGKKDEGKKDESKRTSKAKRLYLHEIRSTQAHDGTIVHHATYKDHKNAMHTHPERGPTATSATPEEAGQHVAEQFGMNQMGTPEPEPEANAGQEPEPEPAPEPGA